MKQRFSKKTFKSCEELGKELGIFIKSISIEGDNIEIETDDLSPMQLEKLKKKMANLGFLYEE